MKSFLKFACELFPLIIFYYLNKNYDMQIASLGLVISTVTALIVTYIIERKLNKMALISTGLVSFFGLMTFFTGNTTFVKIKPTIIYLSFASIILVCAYLKKYPVKHILGINFKLDDYRWRKISYAWGYFFISLAVLNELIWRNCSDAVWIKFKIFGFIPITILFIIVQIPYLSKYSQKST